MWDISTSNNQLTSVFVCVCVSVTVCVFVCVYMCVPRYLCRKASTQHECVCCSPVLIESCREQMRWHAIHN